MISWRKPHASAVKRWSMFFGTITARIGATHFLTRGLPNVGTEKSLHVLAYNLKRAMRIFGFQPLMQAIRA